MTKKEQKINDNFILFKKVSTVDRYNFYEYISVMLDWWVWVTEALESVSSKITSVYFKQKINEIITFISSWDSFSKSMKKIPDIFSLSEISVIEAGEKTWKLSKSLMKVSDDLKKVHNLKNKIKGALTYPTIIFLFLILAIFIVMTYVVPAIMPIFEDAWEELPFMTEALVSSSNFVSNNLWLIFLLFSTVVILFFIYKNTESGKINLEKFLISFPLIWKVYKNYVLANMASTLWNLVWSGVSIVKSLQLTWKASWSFIYQGLLEEVAEKVSEWDWIISSMEEIDEDWVFFPKDYLQMLSVWEKTASLEEVSSKLSVQYEKEVDYSLENLTKWIEPIAILIAWIFVLWFAFAIFWAIIQITQTID